MLTFIAFLDGDKTYPIDFTGFNKIGIVLNGDRVLHPWKKGLRETPLEKVLKRPHSLRHPHVDIDTENIQSFFSSNWRDIDLFHCGLSEMIRGNSDYFEFPLKLPILDAIDVNQHDQRWRDLKADVQAGDLLLTYDTKSFASRVISYLDNGPWSHAATCSGEDTVIEATTAGVLERPLEVYGAARYRLGLYRWVPPIPDPAASIAWSRSRIGNGYSYRKAMKAGLQKLLRHPRTALTPNDLPIFCSVRLVCLV